MLSNHIFALSFLPFAAAARVAGSTTSSSSSSIVESYQPAPTLASGGNPVGITYTANFRNNNNNNGVSGKLTFAPSSHGSAIDVVVDLRIVNGTAGPFGYHVHEKSVPADGNCTGTGGHLDPMMRSVDPACDATQPGTCQVGDLAGKYGKIPAFPGVQGIFTIPSPSLFFLGDG
ncbi:Cell surface superoxide dismutase [Cu-Zn] 4 [Rhizina undulata]